jgi:signal transduction histidine kinase
MLTDTITADIEQSSQLDTIPFEVKPHQLLNDGLAAVGATGGALMLVDQTGKWLEIWARLGPPHKRETDPRFEIGDNSIAGHVADTGEPYLSPDVTQDPRFFSTRSGPPNFRSLLAVPMLFADQVIGIISADHEAENHFSEKNVATLRHFANKVASALARDREHAQLDQTLISLHGVGTLLTRLSGGSDLADVLHMVATQARSVLNADLVTLYQYETGSKEFLVEGTGPTIAGKVNYEAPMKTRIYPDDVAWKIVDQGKSRFFTYAEEEEFLTGFVPEREGQEERPRFAAREKIKSVAALVLHSGEEIVGVMFVNYRQPHEFTDNEKRILETFVNYAAIAIQNARLIQAVRRVREQQIATEQLTVLNSIAPTFAHKLSNAAGTIPVAVQEIRRKLLDPNPYVQGQLERIETDAQELMRMAKQLRQGLHAGAPEQLNILELLSSVRQTIMDDYPTFSFDLQVDTTLTYIHGTRLQLREVFLNLGRNAIEATLPDPGQLTIHAHPSEDEQFLEIEFSDTGRGIDPEDQPRIFDLGFTTKSKRGMGFGLWWCRTVLRSQGGNVQLKSSQSGMGATFVVRLSVAQD